MKGDSRSSPTYAENRYQRFIDNFQFAKMTQNKQGVYLCDDCGEEAYEQCICQPEQVMFYRSQIVILEQYDKDKEDDEECGSC